MPFSVAQDYRYGGGSSHHDTGNNNSSGNERSILTMVAQSILFCPNEERTARELSEMNPNERQLVWADMTGHEETNNYRIKLEDENVEFVTQKIQELKQELYRLVTSTTSNTTSSTTQQQDEQQEQNHQGSSTSSSSSSTSTADALHLALQTNIYYVLHDRFMLAFLRSENFHVPNAAKRMTCHFQIKLELFGPEKLCRNIALSDL